MGKRKKRKISVVIPAYNERGNIIPLYDELKKVLEDIGNYEIIFVDDGSTDGTYDDLKEVHKKGKVKIIKFKRNFGKAAAMAAGLEETTGDIIITMDADLQDNPEEISAFIKKHDGEDLDMIIGWKYPRLDPLSKTVPSKIFNFLIRRSTGLKLHDCDNGFRLFDKEVKEHLTLYGGLYRYIPIIAHSKGFKVGEVKVKHRKRTRGKSKFKFTRLFKGFFDLLTIKYITSYSESPSHVFAGIGLSFLGVGGAIGGYLLYLKYALGESIGTRPLLLAPVLLIITGVQSISFGILMEMFRFSSEKRAVYLVEEKLY